MRVKINLLLVITLMTGLTLSGQKFTKPQLLQLQNTPKHVAYLASDELEGRRAGSAGEKLAMQYISLQFQSAGLAPAGTSGFFQQFEIFDGKNIDPATSLSINNATLNIDKEYFPFPFSAEKTVSGIQAVILKDEGLPWFVDLKEALEREKENPHFDLQQFIKQQAENAAHKKATALFVYNSGSTADNLSYNAKDRSAPLTIPVVYIKNAAAKKYFADETAPLDIELKTAFKTEIRFANNIAGIINNNAAATIIFGAHYDHLGYGEDGNSLERGGQPAIHNGADDNASGTAGLITLAHLLALQNNKQYNYLFIAFSGEELGLLGSKYFTENPTMPIANIKCMINMDMIGRLNAETKKLTVGGYGTALQWPQLLQAKYVTPAKKKKDQALELDIQFDSSGTGPSDHASFYRKNIPVLFFFTGTHMDYHKPGDDADKINYQGLESIVKYIYKLAEDLQANTQPLTFTKTREQQMVRSSFKVTMGLLLDYAYSGSGVKVDGVTEGRPASKAGVIAGDIIIQVGDVFVNSMDNYMEALNKFNKGETTKLKLKRGDKVLELQLTF